MILPSGEALQENTSIFGSLTSDFASLIAMNSVGMNCTLLSQKLGWIPSHSPWPPPPSPFVGVSAGVTAGGEMIC